MPVVNYLDGRSGKPGILMIWSLGLFLLAAACVPLLIYRLGWNIFRKRIHRGYLLALVGSMGLVVGLFIYLPAAKVYLWGFHDGLLTRVTPEQIEAIASIVRATLPMDGYLPGPQKMSLWDEQRDRAVWTKIAAACPIERLDPSCVLQSDADGVVMSWGGALVGHWGVRVSPTGGHQLPSDFCYDPINPRMGVFYTR